jgi:hypothetical protein
MVGDFTLSVYPTPANLLSGIHIHALLGRRVKSALEAGEIGLGDGAGFRRSRRAGL